MLPQKIHIKIAMKKIFFISAFINAVKEKTDRDKRLTMHENIHY